MRAAASVVGDKLRRRVTGERRPSDQTDHTDDSVIAHPGTLAGAHVSSLQHVGSSSSFRSASSQPIPESGQSAFEDAAAPMITASSATEAMMMMQQQHPSAAKAAAAPALSVPSFPDYGHGPSDRITPSYGSGASQLRGYISTAPSSPSLLPSSASTSGYQSTGSTTGKPLRVLCSSGGIFVQSTSGEQGTVYHGGTTRLLNLGPPFTYSSAILQISQAGLFGDMTDDESVTVSYELPGEQGIYVTLTNDEDLSMMYEEWVSSQAEPGPTKKLRLFVEVSPCQDTVVTPRTPSESLLKKLPSLELNRTISSLQNKGAEQHMISAKEHSLAADGHDEEEPVLVDGMEGLCSDSLGDPKQLMDLLQGRMEIISKSDVAVSKLLGAGGYGEVYLGKWREATDVAVKCLSPSLVAPDGDLTKFSHVKDLMDEARLLFSLRHPNVVWVYGIVLDKPGDPPDTRFRAPAIVTEYMASGSLRVSLSRNDNAIQQDWVRVVIALDAARGMEYLHSKQIVHFDLKSGNLLLAWRDRRPTCKVADFGLSKQRQQTYVSGVSAHTGTLPWTAPEILLNPEMVREKVDLYSFAVVMWELWTSKEPHAGIMYPTLLHRRMTEPQMRPPVPGTPEWDGGESPGPAEPAPGWSELMQECWAENPSDRPTFQEVVTRLKAMLNAVKPVRKRGPSETGASANTQQDR